MTFLHNDLGRVSRGTIVVADLEGTEANVRLLDDTNFSRYKSGGQHRGLGGHYRSSPVRLVVPATGRWHVVVDLGGFAGAVRASISVIAT
jgi:hypothetical protein